MTTPFPPKPMFSKSLAVQVSYRLHIRYPNSRHNLRLELSLSIWYNPIQTVVAIKDFLSSDFFSAF